jgi:Zn-dependent M16 (insulinase) family peptidase
LTAEQIEKLVRDYELIHSDDEEEEEEDSEAENVPEFSRSDLPIEGNYTLPDIPQNNVGVFILPTKGISTVRLQCKFYLRAEQLTLFRLVHSIFEYCGAGSRDFREFSMAEDLCSDGFQFSIDDIEAPPNETDGFPLITRISVHALDHLVKDAIGLLSDLMLEPRLDCAESLAIALPKLLLMELRSCKAEAAHPTRYAQVGFSRVTDYSEKIAGFTFVRDLSKIVEGGDYAGLGRSLASFYEEVTKAASFAATVHCSSREQADLVLPLVTELVDKLGKRGSQNPLPSQLPLPLPGTDLVFLELPVTSSQAVVSIKCEPFNSREMPIALQVFQGLLGDVMWTTFREEFGVYDVTAMYQEFEGAFSISTYSDPDPARSIEQFRKTIDEIADGDLDDEDVDHAVVRYFALIDTPIPPQSKGWVPFFRGWSIEWMQARRTCAWEMAKDQLIEVAKYLKGREWHSCIISNRSICEVPPTFRLRAFENIDQN